MTQPETNINLRQHGMLRIEITAIVMLLTALAIILAENLLPEHQVDIAPVGVAAQAVPATNMDAALGNDEPSLLPATWQASEAP